MLKAVTEFVEQGRDLVEAHEGWALAHRGSLVADQVGHGESNGCVAAGQASATAHALIHPGAPALFSGARVRVEEKSRNFLSVSPEDPEEAHVGMPHVGLSIGRLDAHIEEAPRQGEEAVEDAR